MCDGRPFYECSGKGWVCVDNGYFGTCVGDQLRCCAPDVQVWWESDSQCHRGSEPVRCTVPDGTSANCDCDTDSECKAADASKPYCGETYGIRTSQGFHACLSERPEYCGNGNGGGGETYSICVSDCAGSAPKGTVNVDVAYGSGALEGKPIAGTYIYLDNILKGTTGSDGKISFEAAYGSRNVKVECPDSALCGVWTVNVKGTEFKSVKCDCNPPGDSDSDGFSDTDEALLGTDPKNAGENFASVMTSIKYPKGCLDIPGMLALVWKNKGDLIQANSLVINTLNTSSVMAANFEDRSGTMIVMQAVKSAKLDAAVTASNTALMTAIKSSEDVDGFITDSGAVFVITDFDTSTTVIIAVGATCLGWSIGGIYGAGSGIKDNLIGIWDVVQGFWHFATDPSKAINDIVGFIKDIPKLFGKAGEIFHDMLVGILEKGKNTTQKTGLFNSDSSAYLNYQLGFLNGYVTGYVIGQFVPPISVVAVLKYLRLGSIFGKAGSSLKFAKILTDITQKYGGELASTVQKLKYADKISDWTEVEREALVRLVKLKHEKWLGEISEAEAKAATKNIAKLADNDIGNLLNTKLGQQTLKAADATESLIAKQAKLVSEWGVGKVDEVVSKCILFVCYGNRIDDLNKVLKAMPDGLLDTFTPENAVKFLGNSNFAKTAEKIALEFDAPTLNKLNNIDEFEKTINGADAILKRFNSLDDFKISLKICNSPCKLLTKEEFLEHLKNLGVAISKKIDFIDFEKLTVSAKATIKRIEDGGPFRFDEDGGVFKNVEGLLPNQPLGYYKEYTSVLDTDTVRGIERIVRGSNGEIYYTPDHYKIFKVVIKNG